MEFAYGEEQHSDDRMNTKLFSQNQNIQVSENYCDIIIEIGVEIRLTRINIFE